jgi:trigger factor
MQVTETLSDGLKRAYTVVLPGADIEDRRAAKLSELGRTLRLPGFRPGKVPLPVVRQRFGTAVMAEVVQESVEAATSRMLSERGLRPAEPPKVAMGTSDPTAGTLPAGPIADLEFRLEFELLPDIALPDFAAISLTRLRAEVAAATVDAALTRIAERQAEWGTVTEDRGAAPGDQLVVDFAGTIDGAAFAGGSGTELPVELGGTGVIPGFAEQLTGLRPGEQRAFEVTFPADYGTAEVAGRTARFEVTAKALRSRTPVVLDDTMATTLGFESLADMRELVTRRIQYDYDQVARLRVKRLLLDALAERAAFAVPASLVEREFAAIWERLSADLAAGNADAQDSAKDEAVLRSEYTAIAVRRVRLGLLLSEIGRVHGITVTTDEMSRAIRREAQRYPGQELQVAEYFAKNPQAAASLRGPVFEDKVIDFILDRAQVEDRVVPIEVLERAVAGDGADPASPGEAAGALAAGALAAGALAAGALTAGDAAQPVTVAPDAATGDAVPTGVAAGDAAPGDASQVGAPLSDVAAADAAFGAAGAAASGYAAAGDATPA